MINRFMQKIYVIHVIYIYLLSDYVRIDNVIPETPKSYNIFTYFSISCSKK